MLTRGEEPNLSISRPSLLYIKKESNKAKLSTEEMYEHGRCTLLVFMQRMEEIVKYIDNFTSGNRRIFLDTKMSQKSNMFPNVPPMTQSKFQSDSFPPLPSPFSPSSMAELYFIVIREKMNGAREKVQIRLILTEPLTNEYLINRCFFTYGKGTVEEQVSDHGNLRDLICAKLASALEIFPILNYLLMNTDQKRMKAIPLSTHVRSDNLPFFGMQLRQAGGGGLIVFLDEQDALATMKSDGSGATERWDNDLFQALTYIMGGNMITISKGK